MLRRLAFLGCFGCSLLACKKSTDRAPTPGSASGSATAVVGSGSAGSGSAPAKKLTPEARIARYQECLAAFNAGNTDVLKSCYGQASVREQVDSVPELAAEGSDRIVEMVGAQRAAFPDLQITPRLIVVSGDTIAALLHVGGKNSVAAGGMKATNKKLGVFEAEIAVIADDGTFTRDSYYVDQPTVYHQLGLLANDTSPAAIEKPDGAPEIVFAKDDPNEAANKAMIRKLLDSVSEKDAAAIEGLAADGIHFTYHGEKQKIETKKAYMKWMHEMLGSTEEGHVEVKGMWAAGNIVAVADLFTGTPKDVGDGRAIRTNVVQFFRIANGKIEQHQMFANRLNTAVQLGLVDPDQLAQTLAAAAK